MPANLLRRALKTLGHSLDHMEGLVPDIGADIKAHSQ
jgi:hypothetical protein